MVLNFEQIKELIELVAEHRLGGLELERAGLRLKIKGEHNAASPPAAAGAGGAAFLNAGGLPALPAAPPSGATPAATPSEDAQGALRPASSPTAGATDEDELPEDAHVLYSPIVGTFYAAPSPETDPFVQVGDHVEQGQVLCIVEAMKLMNEIEADVSGKILKIYPKNSQAVEFGEPLFVVQPD